ncbi:lung carbonyl reductase [Pyrenophora seminiperda CCB06]|uniref:Lung carbonyl reductase n=1 Tax=Pyrenophora seminiperda CCB06 TaxID=1302712 RepID=A0A3M7MD14_9PLEO|nr:lung carbonyl reductase [Pyrenophora seminiperda CCB06]
MTFRPQRPLVSYIPPLSKIHATRKGRKRDDVSVARKRQLPYVIHNHHPQSSSPNFPPPSTYHFHFQTQHTSISSHPHLPQQTMPPTPPLTLPIPPPKTHRMTYTIGRGEHLVLTYEPYKSALLPLWRFKTAPIARTSSAALYTKFLSYRASGDFIGMDMTRKYLQMGMTRAKRYANYKGGRKYVRSSGGGGGGNGRGEGGEDSGGKGEKVQLEKSQGHAGKQDKEEASGIFKEVWERVKGDEVYLKKKEEFVVEKREWERERRSREKEGGGSDE